ncbi:MAG: flagellar biosynthesis protein FlhB [Deltaproteobacteria bacterium]|nr:flagellar biosynthesis protein FlhB [Deltaproteobacteria bacterium]
MAEDSAQEKTEQPSEKRKREFREEGRVAVSRDVLSMVVLLAGVSAMAAGFSGTGGLFMDALKKTLSGLGTWTSVSNGSPRPMVVDILIASGYVIALPLSATVIAALGASLAQTGFLWTPKPLAPKLERMNPVTRMKELLFSARALVELLKSVAKLVLVGSVAYVVVKADIFQAPSWVGLGPDAMIGKILETMLGMSFILLAAMLPVAVLDYIFNRWDLLKRMKMTKQEVKEEFKDKEGDPHVKAQRRRIMRDLNRNRMIKEIPRSDLVVVNPTHFAVALRYRKQEGGVPRVVAKGVDRMAGKIRGEARKHGVPVVEDRPLARALYRTTKVGQTIPKALYKAVAELLAVIYRLRMARGLPVPL